MTELIEYRVKPVTRFIVTRFEAAGEAESEPRKCRGTSSNGEFDNYEMAYEVAYALCAAEHARLGWPPCDERIQYPRHDQIAANASRGVVRSAFAAGHPKKQPAKKAK